MWGDEKLRFMAALHGPLYSHTHGMWVGWAGCRGLICRVDTPRSTPFWSWVGKRVGQSVSKVKCEHWYWGRGRFFKTGSIEIKIISHGFKHCCSFGYFCITLLDFQHCQSRDCLCLLGPINTLQRQYTKNSKRIFPKMPSVQCIQSPPPFNTGAST